jgi:tRNA(Ile)-lysidine synthase
VGVSFTDPSEAVKSILPGAWAIGVSGGADSVALLELCRRRADLQLHIAHLDHETRAGASAQDAEFVSALAARWKLRCTIARISEIEPSPRERNLSARFRAARLALYRRVIELHQLRGVLLAHHANDQAETVLQRLLRGSGPAGLVGMQMQSAIGAINVCRPLLGVQRSALRQTLISRGIDWREDASNAAQTQQRNRVRRLLEHHPQLTMRAIELANACRAIVDMLRALSPALAESFAAAELSRLPMPLARESARRWLSQRAGAEIDIAPRAIDRLIEMARDAATSPRQHFPGGVLVRRKSGTITAVSKVASRNAGA